MECMSVVLLFINMNYRLLVKAIALLSNFELLIRCYESITQFSIYKGCHWLYRFNENEKLAVTVCRKCNKSLMTADTSNPRFPKMLFEYNSIVSMLKFTCHLKFVDSLRKWKSRSQQQNLMLDVYDGNIWKQSGSMNGGLLFVIQSDYNIMLTSNMDWLQLCVGTQQSSGGS